MRWNSSPQVQQKSAVTSSAVRRSDVSYRQTWDAKRATVEALDRVTWVFRCVDAIASNQARLELGLREGNRFNGKFIPNPQLTKVLNSQSNVGEPAVYFRYRLSAQFLLSTKGVFIQVVKTRAGEIQQLILLPPDNINPIPDKKTFISGYEFTDPADPNRKKTFKPEDIIWIRRPHPFDPYASLTPLASAGIAIETDWLAKMYNRNFLLNDGRPGGIVFVKGDIDDADVEELRARFSGGIGKAGRITVVASDDGADFLDTAVTPRDAQYQETRTITKEEILVAFGVPESVLSNASGKTFDNAEQERLIYWQETMRGHLDLVAAPLDVLDPSENTFVSFDVASVDVLQRAEIKRREFLFREFDGGATDVNEYRVETGRDPIPGDEGKYMFRPKTSTVYATTDGSPVPVDATASPAGRPSTSQPGSVADPARQQEGDQRLTPLDNTPNSAPAAQLSEPAEIEIKSGVIDENFKSIDRWAFLMKVEVGRMCDRMGSVLSEKVSGRKFKKSFFDNDNPTKALFDSDVWAKQLQDDLIGCQKAAYADGVASAGGVADLTLYAASVGSEAAIRRLVSEYEKGFERFVSELGQNPDFREASSSVSAAAKTISENLPEELFETLSSEAFYRGVIDGCEQKGTSKLLVEITDNGFKVQELEPHEAINKTRNSQRYPSGRRATIIARNT